MWGWARISTFTHGIYGGLTAALFGRARSRLSAVHALIRPPQNIRAWSPIYSASHSKVGGRLIARSSRTPALVGYSCVCQVEKILECPVSSLTRELGTHRLRIARLPCLFSRKLMQSLKSRRTCAYDDFVASRSAGPKSPRQHFSLPPRCTRSR